MPKFRIKYTREGLLVYLSHLDMIRMWQRAFIRANVRLDMSQGHSPRPKLGFGPPSAVGYSSDAEYLDASLQEATSAYQLVADLNEVLPADIRVVHARRVMPREPAVSASIEAIAYRVKLAAHLIDAGGRDAVEVAHEQLDRFSACDEVVIERTRKGRIQRIDLRKTVRDIGVEPDDSGLAVTMLIDLTLGPYPKPEEVLKAVFNISDTLVNDVKVRRVDVQFRSSNQHRPATRESYS